MTSFQHAKYIHSALSSVLNQTFSDFEIVIVDDGSNDGTRVIIDSFSDPRIRKIYQVNAGPGAAINRAVSASQGDFIAFLSGDDECEESWLAKLMHLFLSDDVDAIFCTPNLIDDNSKPLPDAKFNVFFNHNIVDSGTALNNFFWKGNFLCAPGTVMRRDAFERVGFFDPVLYQLQDFEYWIRLAKSSHIFYTQERLIRYRIRAAEQNLGSSRNGPRIMSERSIVYERFFRGMSVETMLTAFPKECEIWFLPTTEAEVEQLSWCLFLQHSSADIRNLGWRMIAEQFEKTYLPSINVGPYEITAKMMAQHV